VVLVQGKLVVVTAAVVVVTGEVGWLVVLPGQDWISSELWVETKFGLSGTGSKKKLFSLVLMLLIAVCLDSLLLVAVLVVVVVVELIVYAVAELAVVVVAGFVVVELIVDMVVAN
jgi:hypothetical protein